jgi:outer membrane protein assembly factor BamB
MTNTRRLRDASTPPLVTSSLTPAPAWEGFPKGKAPIAVSDVAVDADDRVYVLTRGPAEVLVYDHAGALLSSWGTSLLSERPHGIAVGPGPTVYCVDQQANAIHRFSRDGELQATLRATKPSATGADSTIADFYERVASVRRGGGPFNEPTSAAVTDEGDVYVTDGYGNARVHVFNSDGSLRRSGGQPGGGPSEFRNIDIAVRVDRDRGRPL